MVEIHLPLHYSILDARRDLIDALGLRLELVLDDNTMMFIASKRIRSLETERRQLSELLAWQLDGRKP